jgi:phage virion morphogenesis protein
MALQSTTKAIVIGVRELEALRLKVEAAAHVDLHDVLDAIGQQQEDAARKRISETKTAPDGTRWAVWSSRYAKTRKGQHSLLRNEGHLADSMDHQVHASEKAVEVGSSMIYAATHLYGDDDRRIPARPYLDTDGGFADSHDREEIRDIVRDFLGGLLT